MNIKKFHIVNFKKFSDDQFDFNDDINIIVGDNESGKSTLLEAIELCLNLNYRGRPLSNSISSDLFNKGCIEAFLAGDKSHETLPQILIEAFLDGNAELQGNNNSAREDTPGLFVRIFFDPELSDTYAEFLKKPDEIVSLPIEFYTFEWFSFAWKKVNVHSKKIGCLFIDPPRLHPTYGTRKYISDILGAALNATDRATLNLNFRQLKQKFDNEPDVARVNDDLDNENEVTDKGLSISVNISSQTSWENNLQLNLDDVPFTETGKGEQHQTQIKLALWHKAKDMDVIMVEEPENHLSHINLVKLIKYIEDKHVGQQVFLTTHSSYVLNKLSFNKLCLIAKTYTRLKDINSKTIKTLKRLPGHDTLRAVLAQKIILVEGPSDELLLKRLYRNLHDGRLPEEDGIDIIVVRGIGFKNYLNIVVQLGNRTHVVKDNDTNYQQHIIDWKGGYDDFAFIEVFSPQSNDEYSLEPALIAANSEDVDKLNALAGVMLSARTKGVYDEINQTDLIARKAFLLDWFSGAEAGGRKVDAAIRIFDSNVEIEYPDYLMQAITFDE